MLREAFLAVLCVSVVLTGHVKSAESSTGSPDGGGDHAGHGKDGIPHDFHWGYHSLGAPDIWGKYFHFCKADNSRQSPINIPSRQTVYDETLQAIDLTVAKLKADERFVMKNNGHTVNIAVPSDIYVQGGSLRDVYKVAGFHFHWGKDSSHGSEHGVSARYYPLEMHMVTYDSERYDNLLSAINGDNSLAVLGTFFEISENDNSAFSGIIDNLPSTKFPPNDLDIPYLDLRELLPKDTSEYYRYEGSLTTPPCYQSVIWSVFRHTQTISEQQMKAFRSLLENHPANKTEEIRLEDNYRPVQDIKKRQITRSFRFEAEISSYSGGNGGIQQHGDGASSGNSLHSHSILGVAMTCFHELLLMFYGMCSRLNWALF